MLSFTDTLKSCDSKKSTICSSLVSGSADAHDGAIILICFITNSLCML